MKKSSAPGAVTLVLMAMAAGMGYAYFLTHHEPAHKTTFPGATVREPSHDVTPGPDSSTPSADDSSPEPKPAKPGGVIYTVSAKGGDDNDLAPKPAHLTRSRHPARDAVKELIRANGSPIPSGTTLRGIKIEGGLATVDFSDAFQTNFHGSDTEEAQTINSILLTLGQFPQIERVQILVEGKPIDALSQLTINEPLPVLRPQTSVAARTAQDADGG